MNETMQATWKGADAYRLLKTVAFTSIAAALAAAFDYQSRASLLLLTNADGGDILGVPAVKARDTGFDTNGVPVLYVGDREVRPTAQGLRELASFSPLPAPLAIMKSPQLSTDALSAYWRDMVRSLPATKLQLLDGESLVHAVTPAYGMVPLTEILQLAADISDRLPDWQPVPLWDKADSGENKVSVFFRGDRVFVLLVKDGSSVSYVTRDRDGHLTETKVCPWISFSFGVGQPLCVDCGTLTYVCGNLGSDAKATSGICIRNSANLPARWSAVRTQVLAAVERAAAEAEARAEDTADRLAKAYRIELASNQAIAALTKIGLGKRESERLIDVSGYALTAGDVYHRLTDTGLSRQSGLSVAVPNALDVTSDIETATRAGAWLDLYVPRSREAAMVAEAV